MNQPIVWAASVAQAAARDLCTDCGISRSSGHKRLAVIGTDGRVKLIPFLQLPLSQLPADFFPITGVCTGAGGDESGGDHRPPAPRDACQNQNMVPPHVWPLVEPYGLTPADYEQAQETGVSAARQPTLTAPSRDQRQN